MRSGPTDLQELRQLCELIDGNSAIAIGVTEAKVRAGSDIAFNCFHEVPMGLMLSVHPSRRDDLLTEHKIQFSPALAAQNYLDAFGNVCTRLVAPPGLIVARIQTSLSMAGSTGLKGAA